MFSTWDPGALPGVAPVVDQRACCPLLEHHRERLGIRNELLLQCPDLAGLRIARISSTYVVFPAIPDNFDLHIQRGSASRDDVPYQREGSPRTVTHRGHAEYS